MLEDLARNAGKGNRTVTGGDLSPFLKIVVTLALHHSVGICPVSRVCFFFFFFCFFFF